MHQVPHVMFGADDEDGGGGGGGGGGGNGCTGSPFACCVCPLCVQDLDTQDLQNKDLYLACQVIRVGE